VRKAIEAIISLHRDHADALLAGTKTVELRRRFPELPAGTRLWIYITRPTGAIAGYVTLKDISRASPASIWRRYSLGVGIDHKAFAAYFEGAAEAVAIEVTAAKRTLFVPLDTLRHMRKNFHPPQIVARLSEAESDAIRKIIQEKDEHAG